jgi:hypothetical protein
MSIFPSSPNVRCTLCGALLPGWLPVPHVPHASLLIEHPDRRYPAEFRPLLRRMATEDIETVVMEAFARMEGAWGEWP